MSEELEQLKKMGKRIRLLRIEKDLTQGELGAVVGVTQGSIGFYESGARAMQVHTALKLSEFFGVSTDYLLGKSDIRQQAGEEDFTDPDIRYIARGVKDRKEAEKLRKVAEALFPDSFKI